MVHCREGIEDGPELGFFHFDGGASGDPGGRLEGIFRFSGELRGKMSSLFCNLRPRFRFGKVWYVSDFSVARVTG